MKKELMLYDSICMTFWKSNSVKMESRLVTALLEPGLRQNLITKS